MIKCGKTPSQILHFFIHWRIHEHLRKELASKSLIYVYNRFRQLCDNAPVMIWTSGLNKLCNYFNRGWLNFTGKTMEQVL
jgi:PAS domain-containing protein